MIDHSVVRAAHPTHSPDMAIPRRVRRAHQNKGSRGITVKRRVRRAHHSTREGGFTLIELLVATTLAALLIVGLGGVVGQVATTRDAVQNKNELTRQARFAMDQMVSMVSHSRLLLLPLADKPLSNWREHVREETVPASPPEGSSTRATAVLAVSLPLYFDLNGDGVADADDDLDGRIDEDYKSNRTHSQAPGIYLIDDDGDGQVDEGGAASDDESSTINDDPVNGVDDDDDNNVDEDPPADMNGDGCPGVCGVDDDGDGTIDDGSNDDDDEDGQNDEDSLNPVVFYLNGSNLMQRTPVPWDEDSSGGVNGRDFIVEPIAEQVTRFRVERVAGLSGGQQLVDLSLELTSTDSGERVSLQTRVRLGGTL
jgi:prepilin-type N-terminal cleavage/methylation domain-containing protein